MEAIQIIQLVPADWPRYREIRLEALRLAPEAFSSTYADMVARPDAFWQGRLREAQDGKAWLLFAGQAGQLVGLIGAYREEEDPGVVNVISVYVTPGNRGQGVGALLMAAILEAVRQPGTFHTARLSVNAEQAAAVALYRRFGFQKVNEHLSMAGDGKEHTEWVMEKRLEG